MERQEEETGERSGRARPVALWAHPGPVPPSLTERLEIHPVRSTEALDTQLERATPDLLILDPDHLPGGWEALPRLAERPPPGELSILAVAATGDGGAALERAFRLGAEDVVGSDATERELVARVRQLLRRARQRRMLRALATTDGLTGLANFRSLSQRLEEEFKRSLRYRHAMAVVMIDVDHLKRLNDRFGHEAGNRALLAFVRHLRSNLREVDFAARYGGDEFVVILPHQTAAEAVIFAERLRQGLTQLRLPVREADPVGPGLTISAGIAAHTPLEPCVSAPELLECADAALYDAKLAGRDRLMVWNAEPQSSHTLGGALSP
ncbi:MAG TPA: diguanylate cyclase [Myxococcaceae bacterium]|nr:diguanylate cyclase [Myxococcaceae bacterium]